jgi:hypothetical protein
MAACIAHSLDGPALPAGLRTSPSSVIAIRLSGLTVSTVAPVCVISMPLRVRALTLPVLPVFSPRRPSSR